jgi:hypothetical protein
VRGTLKILSQGWLLGLMCSAGLLHAAETIEVQLLVYQVTEPGTSPYISRMLVTPDYLRLDQGQQEEAFILFDRKARVIYSINPEDQTILVIDPGQGDGADPAGPLLVASQVKSAQAPAVAGITPQHWQFHVEGRLCLSAVVAPGLMPQAARAYGEYLELLSRQHRQSLVAIPQEMQDPCDLAVNMNSPLAVLEKGLPLRESLAQGRLQELQDFRELFAVPDSSFRLPEGYREIRLGSF